MFHYCIKKKKRTKAFHSLILPSGLSNDQFHNANRLKFETQNLIPLPVSLFVHFWFQLYIKVYSYPAEVNVKKSHDPRVRNVPTFIPTCHSGTRPVGGHSRASLTHQCCSWLWTRTYLWQCPIITPPSCGWSAPLPPNIPVCCSRGVFPLPCRVVNQISAVDHESGAFLLRHRRPRLHLWRNKFTWISGVLWIFVDHWPYVHSSYSLFK